MNFESIREYCLKKKGVTEEFPFGEDIFVYKVMNKMFLLTREEFPLSINVKCDPEVAVELREQYEEVEPGFHMSKTHWNTVNVQGTIPPKKIFEMIDHSYEQVVQGLKKKDRAALEKLE